MASDVSHYDPCPLNFRNKKIPFFGRIHLRNGERATIWASGTTNFAKLTALLAAQFPDNESPE